ncbi:MAG: DUF5924 family protein [Deltaproteobacteria bacterium]|nr:DUF5924 family protein [Deltaproteobacteria bacterium]
MSDIEVKQPTPPLLLARVSRLLPLFSLALGLASAYWMSRKPERAPLIIGMALLGWVAIPIAAVIVRKIARAQDKSKKARIVLWFTLAISQTVMLQALVFPIPFFAAALSPVLAHVPFVVVYVLALVVGWWDPWYEKAAHRPSALVTLQAFAAFVSCLTVLPIVGLTNAKTFTVAAVVVAVGAPMGYWLTGVRRRRTISVVALVLLSGLVVFGAPLVPPVPLSLGSGTLCTSVVARQPQGAARHFVSPPELVCHTAIRAPLGLKDKLVHVWRDERRVLQTVALDVSGGSSGDGFRTWSRLRKPPAGRITCRVETALGQVVGVVDGIVVHR